MSAKGRPNSTGMVAVEGSVQDRVLTRGAKQKLLTSTQHPQATSATGQFTQILAPAFANSLGHQRRAVERTQSCFLGEQENVNFKEWRSTQPERKACDSQDEISPPPPPKGDQEETALA